MDKSRRELLTLGVAAAAGSLLGCRNGLASRAPAPSGPAEKEPEPLPPPLSPLAYPRRRERLLAKMREEGIDFFLATPSAHLRYLTGAELHRSERLIAWVLRKDGTSLVIGPAFEADRLKTSGMPGELRTWQESEDPIALLASELASAGPSPGVAVEGTTWFDDLASLSRRIPGGRVKSATPLLAPIRMEKDPEEIALIRAGARLTVRIIRRLMDELKEGQTEEQLLARAGDLARKSGVTLEGLVQFGAHSAIPHAPAGKTPLRAGDVVLFDMGISVHGYQSDVSRTFAFGRPPERFSQVYKLVQEAQATGIRAARTGIPASAVDEAARSVIRRAGYGTAFTHRLGHGLGLEGHEHPYLVAGNGMPLREGMTVTVEPGIYLSGEFGVRLEDDVVVGAEGAEVLSQEPRGQAPSQE